MTLKSKLPHERFPGDHQDKAAARLFLYKHAVDAPRNGHAITLAGTDPRAEITLLRDYLQWDPKRTWFVDFDKDNREVFSAIKSIQLLWRGVNTRLLDLLDVLPLIGMIGFANLDFMGHLNSYNVLPCLREVNKRMLRGAIVGLTWERGREQLNVKNHSGTRAIKLGSRKGRSLNDRRWAGVLKIVDEASDGSLEFVGGLEYQSNHSPMSVSVFRKK